MIEASRQGETIDALCWRVFGRTDRVTEQVLALNPGLAQLGAILPIGTEVILPDQAEAAPQVRDAVALWD